MRGKVRESTESWEQPGITPAYAGKSKSSGCCRRNGGDHPRVCGEKEIMRSVISVTEGSPPRMRGKVYGVSPVVFVNRITPAYAGKRLFGKSRPSLPRDHPRVCGEKMLQQRSLTTQRGSPPRMRGKAGMCCGATKPPGITPAYAGKRGPGRCSPGSPWDHPRVCGEKTKKIPSHRPFQLHPVPVSFSFA